MKGAATWRRAAGSVLAAIVLEHGIPAFALDLDKVQVSVTRTGRYHIAAQFVVVAPAERVLRALTDYPHLNEVNSAVMSSVVMSSVGGTSRVHVTIRNCIALFCKTFTMVEDVKITGNVVSATIVPHKGDFRSGQASWQVESSERGTRVGYKAVLEPDFWMPPLIGPYLIAHSLRKQVLISAEHLERLNSQDMDAGLPVPAYSAPE